MSAEEDYDIVYSGKLLYLDKGYAIGWQIEEAIIKVLKKLKVPCNFMVNTIKVKGEIADYAYAYFTNPQVVNALLGKNLDGTERVIKTLTDGEWTPPDKPMEDLIKESLEALTSDSTWVIKNEIEEEIRALYNPPMTIRELEPLVVLPEYKYLDIQLEAIKKRFVDCGFDYDENEESLYGGFCLQNGYARIWDCGNFVFHRISS